MSPKNKGKFGRAKGEEIPVEDEFVSGVNRFGERLKPHARRLVALGVGVLIVVFAAVGYQAFQQGKEAEATALFDQALELSGRQLIEDEVERELLGNAGLTERKVWASAEERNQAVLEKLDAIESQYGSTQIADSARLLRAGILLDTGKYDEAFAAYDAVASDPKTMDVNALVAREGKGYALEGKAETLEGEARTQALEKALAAFEAMQPDAEGEGADRAAFHQGRILQALGRKEDAVAKFEQVLERAPSSPFRSDIDNRLATLQ